MDHRLETIASLCRSYLFNYDHISRRELTERGIKKLHRATAPQEQAAPEPPPLGVHVSDGLATTDKVG